MLIQLPSGSSDQQGSRNADACSPFEEGLRRDLASAPIVSYDAMLGGPLKRAIDLTLTLLTLPLWLPVLLAAAAWCKLRHGGPVFEARERIGYGGRPFKCLRLCMQKTAAEAHADGGQADADVWQAIADQAESPRAKWRRALERLPQLFNVAAGHMSLVGPSPLSREALEPLRSARRYYLSMRPGVVGVRSIAADDQEESAQYKIYMMAWSVTTDVLILWDAVTSLRTRGELWKPGFRLAKPGARHAETSEAEASALRRRTGG